MFNENARMFAFHNRFPEIRHNEIMIWASSSEVQAEFYPHFIARPIRIIREWKQR